MEKEDKNTLPIGVFDSGMGGLTVLKALKLSLPHESFIYLGDTARLPYGTKSRHTVIQYATQMASLLSEQGIKLLVVACNTATTAALPALQAMLPDIPVVGVIEPGARAAVAASKNEHILVLATETTVRSAIYTQTIQKMMPDAEVSACACGLFVALAEEGCIDEKITDCVIEKYLTPVFDGKQDCILLGCTHFPVFKKALARFFGEEVMIVDSATETASAVKEALAEKNIMQPTKSNRGTRYLVTDLPERFKRIGELFLEEEIALDSIELTDGC
jgi:glutamate racemase